MNEVGPVGLIAAFVVVIYAMISGAIAGNLHSARTPKNAQRAVQGLFAITTLAVVAIEYLILTNDFHCDEMVSRSFCALSLLNKFPVFGAGQEGSLLF